MAAPLTLKVNPGVRLLFGLATPPGIPYVGNSNGQTRTRITSITLCDVSKTGAHVTVTLGATAVLFDYALPADGSPFCLTLNETLDASETLTVSSPTSEAVAVRVTGEEIFTT